MTATEISEIQRSLGLSDAKFAQALSVTRQTIRNWRTGGSCPLFVRQSLRWMMELRRIDASNDNLPALLRASNDNAAPPQQQEAET